MKVFRQPGKTFSAIVRFSAPGTIKGRCQHCPWTAIKLLDVAGARAF
jgi:hypothetical protein